MKKDLISVVIPCYQGEKYLDRCFTTLINQTYNNIEIIIVDDGSTDRTPEIIAEYVKICAEKGIQVKTTRQENAGPAAALNTGLKYIEGEYLVWQDCDDYYEKDAFESLKTYLKEHPEVDFVRGNSAKRLEDSVDEIEFLGRSKYPEKQDIFELFLLRKDVYRYAGIFMVRMDFFDRSIKDREIYAPKGRGQNLQLILPLAYCGKCGYLDKLVYNYIQHSESHHHNYKTFRKALNVWKGSTDIICQTINSIDMPVKEKNKYKIKLYKFSKRVEKNFLINQAKYDTIKTKLNIENQKENLAGKRVILYGLGFWSEHVNHMLSLLGANVVYLCTTTPENNKIIWTDKPIITADKLVTKRSEYDKIVISTTKYQEEIYEALISLGIEPKDIVKIK